MSTLMDGRVFFVAPISSEGAKIKFCVSVGCFEHVSFNHLDPEAILGTNGLSSWNIFHILKIAKHF